MLLFSEVGCEGLDYQFCDCIVNYDLPWNPMRVEQRIGRIDRNGQQSESVAIVNLITPGTVDADIYERCLVRIGVFENALGGSEEILGDIASEIKNIAKTITLSEEDRSAKLQQLADNKIRLVQEQDKLEQQQMELFGLRLPKDQMKKEIEEATSFWLSPASLRRLVTLYLQNTCGKGQEFILGEKSLKTLRLSQDARNSLLHDFQQLPKQNTPVYREWETWLKESNPLLSITFESACASQNPAAAFIMPLHPLVKQAALSLEAKPPAATTLKVQTSEVSEGRYEFVIYQWRFHGIREDLVLKPIASAKELTPHLGRLLEKALDAPPDGPGDIATPTPDALDVQHYKLWSEARARHQQHTQELVVYRKESLSTSHRARLALLQDQLKQAGNENIQRMRRSQIETVEADYERRIQELDRAMERADILAEPVGVWGFEYIWSFDYKGDVEMANADPSEMIEEIRAWVDECFLSLKRGIEYQEIAETVDQLERLQIPVSEEIKSEKAARESSFDASNEGESQLTFLVKELSSLVKDINHRLRDIRSQKTARGRKAPPKRTASRISRWNGRL